MRRKSGIALYGRVFVELKTLGHMTMHRAAKCACAYHIWQTLVALLCCVGETQVFSKLCWIYYPPPLSQSSKSRFLRAKYRFQYISVGQNWKFFLGRTFIAICCPRLVFWIYGLFLPSFFAISAQLGKPNRNEASYSNIYTFLFFVHQGRIETFSTFSIDPLPNYVTRLLEERPKIENEKVVVPISSGSL